MELSVSEAVKLARNTIASHPDLSRMTVTGEVSGFKLYSSGHAYFTLKDADASVSCVMFSSVVNQYEKVPKNGDLIKVLCKADLYVSRGQFQLQIFGWEPAGAGAYYEQFLQLHKFYQDKGYFDPQIKKQLPAIIRRVGVITSPKGAVIHDILRTSKQIFDGVNILLYPVTVQGETTAEEVTEGIEYFNKKQNVDVIIVARGGGSMEDLWPFNHPDIVEAAYKSTLPIISAVGHESDFHLLDYVADFTAATPTMAADFCWSNNALQVEAISDLARRLHQCVLQFLRVEQQRLDLIIHRSMIDDPTAAIDTSRKRLEDLDCKLSKNILNLLEREKTDLDHLKSLLESLNPRAILRRGYATVSDSTGKLIQSLRDWQKSKSDELTIDWHDGRIVLIDYRVKDGNKK